MYSSSVKTLYYVYILADRNRSRFKTGVTTHLPEHPEKLDDSPVLVYYEAFETAVECVKREAKLSDYSQRKLRKLVEGGNPELKAIQYIERTS